MKTLLTALLTALLATTAQASEVSKPKGLVLTQEHSLEDIVCYNGRSQFKMTVPMPKHLTESKKDLWAMNICDTITETELMYPDSTICDTDYNCKLIDEKFHGVKKIFINEQANILRTTDPKTKVPNILDIHCSDGRVKIGLEEELTVICEHPEETLTYLNEGLKDHKPFTDFSLDHKELYVLLKEKIASPNTTHNESPTIIEFYYFLKENPNMSATGYYRENDLTLNELWYRFGLIIEKDVSFNLIKFCTGSEILIEGTSIRCYWD